MQGQDSRAGRARAAWTELMTSMIARGKLPPATVGAACRGPSAYRVSAVVSRLSALVPKAEATPVSVRVPLARGWAFDPCRALTAR